MNERYTLAIIGRTPNAAFTQVLTNPLRTSPCRSATEPFTGCLRSRCVGVVRWGARPRRYRPSGVRVFLPLARSLCR